jgi:hypothetical protein
MTIRILRSTTDAGYFLRDPATRLAPYRDAGWARTLSGGAAPYEQLVDVLAASRSCGRPALDVVVAAPKQLSVLLAIESDEVVRSVLEAHDRAVDAALGYLEEPRHRGEVPDAVSFTHGVNRLGDPHLHAHVVVSPRRADGSPLATPALRARARAADALYLAELRAGIPAATHRTAWLSRRGTFEVEGVDDGLVAAASLPRGRDGRAVLVERDAPRDAASLLARWEALVRSAPEIGSRDPPGADRGLLDEHRFAAMLGDGAVGRNEVVAAWATACTFGARAAQVLAAAELVAPRAAAGGRVHAVTLRAGGAVGRQGARPVEPQALRGWVEQAAGERARDGSSAHRDRVGRWRAPGVAATLLAHEAR